MRPSVHLCISYTYGSFRVRLKPILASENSPKYPLTRSVPDRRWPVLSELVCFTLTCSIRSTKFQDRGPHRRNKTLASTDAQDQDGATYCRVMRRLELLSECDAQAMLSWSVSFQDPAT